MRIRIRNTDGKAGQVELYADAALCVGVVGETVAQLAHPHGWRGSRPAARSGQNLAALIFNFKSMLFPNEIICRFC